MTSFNHLEEPPKPACFDHLAELSEAAWGALSILRWLEKPHLISDEVRNALTKFDLIDGNSLTPEGRLAAEWAHEFTELWSHGDGKIYMSCAVVASDGKGNDVLLYSCGPAIDWHVDQIGRSCSDLGLEAPSPGVWVWEGSMGTVRVASTDWGEDWDHEAVGDWREPTAEEWESIKEEECPWTRETLPRWSPPPEQTTLGDAR